MTSINVPGAASAPIYRREDPLPTPEIGTGEAVTQAGKLVSEYAQQQDRVRQAMNQMIVARQKNIAAQQAAAEQQAEKERMNQARESQAKTDADARKAEKDRQGKMAEKLYDLKVKEFEAKQKGEGTWARGGGKGSENRSPKFSPSQLEMLKKVDTLPDQNTKLKTLDDRAELAQVRLANFQEYISKAEEKGDLEAVDRYETQATALKNTLDDIFKIKDVIISDAAAESTMTQPTAQPAAPGAAPGAAPAPEANTDAQAAKQAAIDHIVSELRPHLSDAEIQDALRAGGHIQ